MKIGDNIELFLNEYATFNHDGLLTDLSDITNEFIDIIDGEFITPLHEELVDRRDFHSKQHPNDWFNKTINLSVEEWHKRYLDFKDYGVLNYIVKKATKFYDQNISNIHEIHLFRFESFIRDNRNEPYEDYEKGLYGYRPSKQFYIGSCIGK